MRAWSACAPGQGLEAEDRAGRERLLRYCARPAFASERLSWDGSAQPVRDALPRPLPTLPRRIAPVLLPHRAPRDPHDPRPPRRTDNPAPLTPRARAPPELETEWAGTPAFTFDQSPSWDPTAAPPGRSKLQPQSIPSSATPHTGPGCLRGTRQGHASAQPRHPAKRPFESPIFAHGPLASWRDVATRSACGLRRGRTRTS
jgi:hypothetical protein